MRGVRGGDAILVVFAAADHGPGEPVDRLESSDARLIAYLRERYGDDY